VIGENQQAGGIYKARNRNVFAWADLSAGAKSIGSR
jgi:hypothetical protein